MYKYILAFCLLSFKLIAQTNEYNYYSNITQYKLLKNENKIDTSISILLKSKELLEDQKMFSYHYDILEYYTSINDTNRIKTYILENKNNFDSSFIIWYNKNYYNYIHITLEAKYNIIPELDSLICLMEKEDQNIRFLDLGTDNLSKNIFIYLVDSLNYLRLNYILRKYGYPNKYNYRYQYDLNTLLIHIRNYEKFMTINNFLIDAIKSKYLTPYFYAWAYDESYKTKFNQPYFYYSVSSPPILYLNDLSKEEIEFINQRRTSIQLPNFPVMFY
jgi:hypothetical protein